MTISYDEKRDYIRMPIDCDVSYNIIGNSEKFYGKGTDLCASGVMFLSDKDLALGTILKIHIHPHIKTVKDLTARAEVVRSIKDGDNFVIGVKMSDVQ